MLAVDFYGISHSAGNHVEGVLETWVHITHNTSSYIMAGLCFVVKLAMWHDDRFGFLWENLQRNLTSPLSTEKRGWSSPSCWPSCSWRECCVTWWRQPGGGFACVILACVTRGNDGGEAVSPGWLWHQTLNKHPWMVAAEEPSTREHIGRHCV